MTGHKTGTRKEWLADRFALLAAEKELTPRSDELARRRREMQWVRIDQEYSFETDDHGNLSARVVSLLEADRPRRQFSLNRWLSGVQGARGCRPHRLFSHVALLISRGSPRGAGAVHGKTSRQKERRLDAFRTGSVLTLCEPQRLGVRKMVEINPLMNAQTAFNLLTPFGLIFFLLIGFWYVLPRLYKEDFTARSRLFCCFPPCAIWPWRLLCRGFPTALRAPLSPIPAAYGDLAVSTIALVAAVASRWKLKLGIALAWAYAILGALDFVNAKSLGSDVRQDDPPRRLMADYLDRRPSVHGSDPASRRRSDPASVQKSIRITATPIGRPVVKGTSNFLGGADRQCLSFGSFKRQRSTRAGFFSSWLRTND